MQRPVLSADRVREPARNVVAAFHADVVAEVIAAVDAEPVVIVGMAQNPVVKRARKLLTEAQIPFKYLEYGSYVSEWKKRLAIKLWAGWPTFPMVFVKGNLVGGADETEKALADGSLKELLG